MGDVGRRLAEIWRILKPRGLYQGTMLSKRDAQFGRGRPVAPDTFIRGGDAKAHAHYYCDLAGLAALFAGFELRWAMWAAVWPRSGASFTAVRQGCASARIRGGAAPPGSMTASPLLAE